MASTSTEFATSEQVRTLSPARIAAIVAATVALCISANLQIPIQPVPITMQVLALDIIALTLSPRDTAAAVTSNLIIGALGAPVFSDAMGGVAKLLGPTGGFIIGFVPSATLASWLNRKLDATKLPSVYAMTIALLASTTTLYVFGWAWLMVGARLTPQAAFAAGVTPFVVVDTLKAIIAACAVSFCQLARSAR